MIAQVCGSAPQRNAATAVCAFAIHEYEKTGEGDVHAVADAYKVCDD
jgi:hypothetical protein